MRIAAAPTSRRELAQRQLDRCELCEHRCGVKRSAGELGYCKAGALARVFRHRVEFGEELELIPSHLFYLSGCDLRCKFCIAGDHAFNPQLGTELTADFFQYSVRWGRQQGAVNVQWVGGEPTIHLPAILRVMEQSTDLPPIVWKSDFYGTAEAFDLLEGIVDVYVADFKFGNDQCARRIARVDRYVEVVTRNLFRAAGQGRLIVRHLLLPGHFDCCYRPIIQWLSDEMPEVNFSLRDGYRPHWQAHHDPCLGQALTPFALQQARSLACAQHLNLIR